MLSLNRDSPSFPAMSTTTYNPFQGTSTCEKKSGNLAAAGLAPPSKEILNIWWDFRKVAEFIDINKGWLLPLLDKVSSKIE